MFSWYNFTVEIPTLLRMSRYFHNLADLIKSREPRISDKVINKKKGKVTHKKDDVNDDENIFDEIDAATVRVAILWLLHFDLFLRFCRVLRAGTTVATVVIRMAASVGFTAVIIVVVIVDVIVDCTILCC